MTIFLTIVIPLFVSLISYAAILTLKHIEYRATVKRLNEDLSAARAELAAFDEKKDQEISTIMKMHETRIEKLTETISDLQGRLSQKTKFIHSGGLLWLPGDATPFCSRCHEADNKQIHTKIRKIRRGDNSADNFRYTCPQCGLAAPLSQHPLKEE